MKFYIAGKWDDRATVRVLAGRLEGRGHGITVDWTTHVNPSDLGEIAMEDVRGVRDADIFVGVLIDDYAYKGLWVEMGIALALYKPIFMIGHAGDSCIFMNHPRVAKFEAIDEFLKFVDLAYGTWTEKKPTGS